MIGFPTFICFFDIVRFTGYKSAQKPIAKFFLKRIDVFMPGGILKYFGVINDVTRKVHVLHG